MEFPFDTTDQYVHCKLLGVLKVPYKSFDSLLKELSQLDYKEKIAYWAKVYLIYMEGQTELYTPRC